MGYATWNPSDKHAGITLSNGDLTAQHDGTGFTEDRSVRATVSKNYGKWYYEITSDNGLNQNRGGWGNSSHSLSAGVGSASGGYGHRDAASKFCNNVYTSSYGSAWYLTNDVLGIAIDFDAGKIWFSQNGVWTGDPEAGTDPACTFTPNITLFPMCSVYMNNSPYGKVTANFGESSFSYSVPSGFDSGVFDTFITSDITLPMSQIEGFTGIYSSLSIPMMQADGFTGIYSAPSIPMPEVEGFTGIHSSLSIPMTRANATLSDNMVHIESSVTIPSMTAEMTQAKQIWGNVTAPMMTAEITERETVLGNVTIPMMTAELASGVHADLEVTAPMMIAEGTFSNQCEVKIPMMTVEMEGQVGRVISSDVSVPMMTVEITGKTEHLVNCDVPVPMMRMTAGLMTGKIITGATTLPMMTASLTSHEEITGDIDVLVPMMEAYMVATTERAECVVLRYVEPVL